jgi:RNA recognition motif-containing protein
MAVRLFVGNLTYDVTEAELREYLSPAGALVSVRLPTERPVDPGESPSSSSATLPRQRRRSGASISNRSRVDRS